MKILYQQATQYEIDYLNKKRTKNRWRQKEKKIHFVIYDIEFEILKFEGLKLNRIIDKVVKSNLLISNGSIKF